MPLPVLEATQEDPALPVAHRIRRCTYRRLVLVDPKQSGLYNVECLFPDRKLPVPLGDLEAAMPVCNACTAAHIFRADED